MASTNREYDDSSILRHLEKSMGLVIPELATTSDISITYDEPLDNVVRQAVVSMRIQIVVDIAEADAMLDDAS